MKIKDLISKLNKFNPDDEIKIEVNKYNSTIDYWELNTYTELEPYYDSCDKCVYVDFVS